MNMTHRTHILRSLVCLILWISGFMFSPEVHFDGSAMQKENRDTYFLSSATCCSSTTQLTVVQKNKGAGQKYVDPSFAIELPSLSATQSIVSSNTANALPSFHSLASYLIYTETTSSRL